MRKAFRSRRCTRWARTTCTRCTTTTCGFRSAIWSGGENKGWHLITTQLNHERVALCSVGTAREDLHRDRRMGQEDAQRRRRDDHRPALGEDEPRARLRQARGAQAAQLAAGLGHRRRTRSHLPMPRRSRCSAPSSTSRARGCSWRFTARPGCFTIAPRARSFAGRLEKYYRMSLVLTFGGGTNEIQRDIICQAGLRMPRLGRR